MRAEKQLVVEELKAKIESASAIIFTDYTRTGAERLAELRAALSDRNGRYMVVKNRLFALAAKAAGLPDELPGFQGQVGVAFTDEESSIAVVKALVAFRREHEAVELLGGFVGGRSHSAAELKELSRLPSRPVMQAQVLGMLQAVPRGMVSVLAGRLRSFLYLVKARVEQEGGVQAEETGEANGEPSAELEETTAEGAVEAPVADEKPAEPAGEPVEAAADAPAAEEKPSEAEEKPAEAAGEPAEEGSAG